MRGLLATLMLLVLNLQPLAGGALCLRHHSAQDGTACEAAMQSESGMGTRQHAAVDAGDTPPMADECASAVACARQAPVVAGYIAPLELSTPLLHSETRPPATRHATGAPAAIFRPPIA
ncbi:MAG: hypothetical protein ACREL6_05330 [Gemmatimonadales bacterium]